MRQSLLWYDQSKKSLAQKAIAPIHRYESKFGRKPTIIYVNHRDIGNLKEVMGIEVQAKSTILPNHLWLGIKQ